MNLGKFGMQVVMYGVIALLASAGIEIVLRLIDGASAKIDWDVAIHDALLFAIVIPVYNNFIKK